MKFIIHIVLFALLTITTQIGGVVYLLSILTTRTMKVKNRTYRFLTFAIFYLISTYIITPKIAPLFGREKITNNEFLQNQFLLTTLCNRNYVKPRLNKSLQIIGKQLQKKYSNIRLVYLDANFPFIDKFPLLPHLSHSDGKKVDVSFIYKKEGKLTNKKPATSGYGFFEHPKENEYNQIKKCKDKGYWQYDFPKYLTFGSFNSDLEFSLNATRTLVRLILQHPSTQKVFIEPHLKKRMNLINSKIRYHGCGAVRHDDHIHFQIK